MARTRVYRNGVLEAEDFPLEDVSDYLEDPSTVVWLDVCEPDADDIGAIAEELQLHRLAIEDAVAEHQRPQLHPHPDPPVRHRLLGDARLRVGPSRPGRGGRLHHPAGTGDGPQVAGLPDRRR